MNQQRLRILICDTDPEVLIHVERMLRKLLDRRASIEGPCSAAGRRPLVNQVLSGGKR